MSFIYDYKPADSLPHFDCADGIHKVKIAGVRFSSSKNGKQFLAISLEVEGSALPFVQKVYEGNGFDFNMTRIFDAFGIPRGNFNLQDWNGKIASAEFVHTVRTVDGRVYKNAEIKDFFPLKTATAPNIPQNQRYAPVYDANDF